MEHHVPINAFSLSLCLHKMVYCIVVQLECKINITLPLIVEQDWEVELSSWAHFNFI